MKHLINATIEHPLTYVKQGGQRRGRHRAPAAPTVEALERLIRSIPWKLLITSTVQLVVALHRPHG